MKKIDILKSLVLFNQDIDLIAENLSKFDWDSEPEIFLTTENVYDAMEKYLNGTVTAEEIEKWANVIEMRDDIVFEEGREELIKKIIFYLANSEINFKITRDFILEIKDKLGKLN